MSGFGVRKFTVVFGGRWLGGRSGRAASCAALNTLSPLPASPTRRLLSACTGTLACHLYDEEPGCACHSSLYAERDTAMSAARGVGPAARWMRAAAAPAPASNVPQWIDVRFRLSASMIGTSPKNQEQLSGVAAFCHTSHKPILIPPAHASLQHQLKCQFSMQVLSSSASGMRCGASVLPRAKPTSIARGSALSVARPTREAAPSVANEVSISTVPTPLLAGSAVIFPLLLQAEAAFATGGAYGLLEGRTAALVHPAMMFTLLASTLYAGYLGWNWRRTREVGDYRMGQLWLRGRVVYSAAGGGGDDMNQDARRLWQQHRWIDVCVRDRRDGKSGGQSCVWGHDMKRADFVMPGWKDRVRGLCVQNARCVKDCLETQEVIALLRERRILLHTWHAVNGVVACCLVRKDVAQWSNHPHV